MITTEYFELMATDLILIVIFSVSLIIAKGARPLLIAFICFCLTVVYSSETIFNIWWSHPVWLVHTMYGLPFVCAVFFVPFRVKISLFTQALVQLIMVIDSILTFGRQSDWLYENYLMLQIASILFIIISFFGGGYERSSNSSRRHSTGDYIPNSDVLRGSPYYSGVEKG